MGFPCEIVGCRTGPGTCTVFAGGGYKKICPAHFNLGLEEVTRLLTPPPPPEEEFISHV